jgi:hypothetical protein
MLSLSEPLVLAFRDELRKQAALNPALGAGATLGALGGLATGGFRYMQAKARGDEDAGSQALGAGAKGALIGAAGGAALGGLSPKGLGKSVSDFGQRQVHSMTGWTPKGSTPKEGLRSIGGGAANTAERLQAAHAAGDVGEIAKAEKAHAAAEHLESMGATSLPGVVKAMGRHGVLPVAHAGLKEQLSGAPAWQKAMVLGLPAVGMYGALKGPSVNERGQGRGEQIGQQIGSAVGGVAGSLIPITGNIIAGEAGGAIGKGVGRVVDRVRGRVSPAQNPTDPLLSSGQHATETVIGRGSGENV